MLSTFIYIYLHLSFYNLDFPLEIQVAAKDLVNLKLKVFKTNFQFQPFGQVEMGSGE